MSDVLERAKGHYLAKISEPKLILVPEWGDENGPFEIYSRPMNLKEQSRILRKYQEDSTEALVETLIVRARDKNGEPIFKPVHRTELMREVDSDVIGRIVSEMNAEDDSQEEAEGN